jgi:putative toxin-antitoxin system antitoxin component (TIGR02293 family)
MAQSSIENILQEPVTAYAATKSRFDLVALSRKGIKKQALLNLGNTLDLNLKQLAALLPVTERTLQRREAGSLLNTAVSEQVILLAELTEKGSEVFGDIAPFNEWLREKNTALGNRCPLHLLDTTIGIQLVTDELGKLVHGVFA